MAANFRNNWASALGARLDGLKFRGFFGYDQRENAESGRTRPRSGGELVILYMPDTTGGGATTSREPGQLGRTAALLVYSVILGGVAVLAHSIWDLVARPIGPQWLILAVLTVSTAWLMLQIPTTEFGSGTSFSFSISDTFNIAAAVLFGPSVGAITAALDALVLSSQFSVTKRTAYRIPFNIAVSAIAIWVAAQVYFAVAGDRTDLDSPFAAVRLVGPLVLLGAVNYLVNVGLVTLAVSLERQLPMFTVWRKHFVGLWVTHFGGVLAAVPLMLWQLLKTDPGVLAILILVVPLPILLYTTFRHSLGRVQDQVNHLGQVNRVYVAVIETLAQAVDAKDQVTHDHIRRVQTEAVRLARALGVTSEEQLQAIMAAALLHDVGKLAVPEHILNKPGRLTASEFEVMKKHAPAGADILSVVGFPYPVVPIVRHHHENWDGSGYPDGLSGEDIPIGARILSVVDCFDALTSHRPYRPRLEDAAALTIVIDRRGSMYDPRVVDAFLKMHEGAAAIATESPALPAAAAAPSEPPAPASRDDREIRDLEISYELGRTLGAASTGRHIGDSLWSFLQPRVPASTFVLYLYDQSTDALVAVHEDGQESAGLRGSRIALGERLSGWVGATRQPIMNSDARLDLDEAARDASALRSALAVPVEADGRLVGVLSLYGLEAGAFDDSHRRVAQMAAYATARSGVSFAHPDPA
jgi:putative nucleotidyltransferase with HDIG domain